MAERVFESMSSIVSTTSTRRLRYQQVMDGLEQEIRSGRYRPGDRLPPLKTMGDALKVNTLTVRKAVHALSRKGLLEVRHGVGAFVREGSSAPLAKTLRIAVAYSDLMSRHQTNHPFLGACLEGVRRCCKPSETVVQLNPYHEGEFTVDPAVDGVLHLGYREDVKYYDLLESRRIPLVEYSGYPPAHRWAGMVRLDEELALRQAVEHLRSLGHQRIAFVCYTKVSDPRVMHEGFARLAIEHGLGSPRELLVLVNNPLGEPHWSDAERLFSLEPLPTAVIVRDEFLADLVLRYCELHGIAVPQRLAMATLQDLWPSGHRIGLTCMFSSETMSEAAFAASRMLLGRIRGEEAGAGLVTLPPKMVIRASSTVAGQ